MITLSGGRGGTVTILTNTIQKTEGSRQQVIDIRQEEKAVRALRACTIR
jgi:hypothetical protein